MIPRGSQVEAALARGDAKLGRVIFEVWKAGGKLEQDNFNYDRWLAGFETAGLDISDYANAEIPRDAELPWDCIDVGVSKRFLAAEDARADEGRATADCRYGACSACGIREALAAVYGREATCPPYAPINNTPPQPTAAGTRPDVGTRVLFVFQKGEQVRWLGHLDLQRVFERAVRMSGLDVAYTQGFNPHAKMSIASALPLGATADREWLVLSIAGTPDPLDAAKRLNARLPEGLQIVEARVLAEGKPIPSASNFVVEIGLPQGVSLDDLRGAVDEILSRHDIPTQRETSKKGKRKIVNIRPGISDLGILRAERPDRARLAMRLPHLEFTVKPAEVVSALAEVIPGLEMISIHRAALVD